jgi:hypothetical protein
MRLCFSLFVFLTVSCLAQKTSFPNIQAQSSGTCSPNIVSNQGTVRFVCRTSMDQMTAGKIVSLLNQLLANGGVTTVSDNVNKKLDRISDFLQHPPPIQRTERFAVMIPFDTTPNSFPVPFDAGGESALSETYSDLYWLAVYATAVPSSLGTSTGPVQLRAGETLKIIPQIAIPGEIVSTENAPDFLGRLLQYYLFKEIDSLQRGGLKQYVGYPAEAVAGIEPPNAEPYANEKLLTELAGNRFFKRLDRADKSPEESFWEFKPIRMPAATEIRLREAGTPPQYILELKRSGYFEVSYKVEYFVGTGLGNVPDRFANPHSSAIMQCALFVTMHYEIQHLDERDFHSDLYVRWADSLYSGLEQKLEQPKRPK